MILGIVVTDQRPSYASPADAQAPILCPVGENQCVVIDEVAALRDQVLVLAEQVRTDTLTGLFNFRHLRQCLEQEMERSRRTEQSTAIIMIDLDHFKQVNDRWGHEVGNQALIATAQVMRNTTRLLDIPCRYGGEEFMVILPSTDLIMAIQVAERLRSNIEQAEILVAGEDIGLTASMGVDLYQGNQDDTVEQFIARADSCLYEAKQAGRNQVCHGTVAIHSEAAVSVEERDVLAGFFSDEYPADYSEQ